MPDNCDLLCLDLPKAESARRELPDMRALNAAAGASKAFADPTRLQVAAALAAAGTACVCDVAWIVGRDQKLVSHHLRALKTAGMATSGRDGKTVLYELTSPALALLRVLAVTKAAA